MVGRGLFLTALALLSLSAPRVVQAQATTPPATPAAAAPMAPLDPKIVSFAKLHAQLNATRDEFFAKLGRTHDDQAKAALREELNKRITEMLTQHSMTQQEYQRQIFVISSDAAQRGVFERALKEAQAAAAL